MLMNWTAEAYRQKFRTLFKSEKCTYLEFARVKENMFDRWCSSVKVTTKRAHSFGRV